MKITYDKKADAMYIYLNPKKKITDTKEVADGWIVDYAGKEIVGIEILAASKALGSKFRTKPTQSTVVAHKIR